MRRDLTKKLIDITCKYQKILYATAVQICVLRHQCSDYSGKIMTDITETRKDFVLEVRISDELRDKIGDLIQTIIVIPKINCPIIVEY